MAAWGRGAAEAAALWPTSTAKAPRSARVRHRLRRSGSVSCTAHRQLPLRADHQAAEDGQDRQDAFRKLKALGVQHMDYTSDDGDAPPLEGKFSYKMVKVLPTEVLFRELRSRGLPTWGRKDQVASRVYTALNSEGRALSKEESAVADAVLGLTDLTTGGDGDGEGGASSSDEGEMRGSAELQANPLLALQASASGQFLTERNQERLLSNVSGLQVSFLWGAASPSGVKHSTSCVVRTLKSVWLFECGEDTQRNLARSTIISWSKLERIFVSSMAADNILGLPGMLCTISAAREKGHEMADTPLHVYGPQGLADFINTMLSVSRTYLEMPVLIHELCPGPVPPEEAGEATQINPRSRLFATRVPPDQLNPEGYYDAGMRTLLARHSRKRSNPGIDLRAGVVPLPLPPPGDPARTGLRARDLTWTLRIDHEWVVQAAPLRSGQPTLGYLLQEADRTGRLYVERAQQLGVPPGEDYARLKEGESVVTPAGRRVTPEEVLGPVRRGRRLAIIGACHDSLDFAEAAARRCERHDASRPPLGCALVVHSMTRAPGAPLPADGQAPRSGAAMAGAAAAALGAQDLVLWQQQASFVDSPQGDDPAFAAQAVAEARGALGSDNVSLAGCYWVHQPEREEEQPPPALAAG